MEVIFYKSDDSTGQSQLAKAVANLKYPDATVYDTKGSDNTAMAAFISGLDDGSCDDIVICVDLVTSHAEGKFTAAQAIDLIAKLKSSKQGETLTGTCQANSTKTEIKLAASGPSETDDAYNLKLIATTGDEAVERLITDYDGTDKVCTVAETTNAIDASEDYTVYLCDHLYIVGETYGTANAGKLAWDTLYSTTVQTPLIIGYMNNASTLYEKVSKTATGIAAGTLTDTGEFTSGDYDGLDYYVYIESATTGGGQSRKITSNTDNTLTLEADWDTTPTGTIVYQVVREGKRALWNKYLPYAVCTYLSENDEEVQTEWNKMLDRYGDLANGQKYSYQDLATVEEYVDKGKVIADAVWQGVVS